MARICSLTKTITKEGTTKGSAYYGVPITATGTIYVDYSITQNLADRVVITTKVVASVTSKIQGTSTSAGRSTFSISSAGNTWNVNGVGYTMTQPSSVDTAGTATKDFSATQTTTVYKTKTAQNVPVNAGYNPTLRMLEPTSAVLTDSIIVSGTIPISAKTSYTVSYNLNGGTSSIPNQTKWYGETLTLTTTKPTKSGYTFRGWATTLANAQAGNANQGATYTGNANATFYAVWELNYSKPTINNVSIERCLQNGTEDDEGDYASVYFEWKVFKSSLARYYGGNTYPYANNSVSNCTITVGTQTLAPTLSVAEGSDTFVVGSGTFELDTAYDATISITDSQTIVTNHTTTTGGTLPTAFFPMDFNADASAVGFFMSAPDAGDGAYFGKDVHIYVDASTTSGTDGAIAQALTNLGWTDVLS